MYMMKLPPTFYLVRGGNWGQLGSGVWVCLVMFGTKQHEMMGSRFRDYLTLCLSGAVPCLKEIRRNPKGNIVANGTINPLIH